MAKITLKLKGIDTVIEGIRRQEKEIKEILDDELNAFGVGTVAMAKVLVPTNESALKQSISFVKRPLNVSIAVNSGYAAYVEFGTKKYAAKYIATLPSEWKEFAAQFRGSGGGSMDEFIQNIMAWVKRKGIGGLKTNSGNISGSRDSQDQMQQAAYAIALNILQNGIKHHPFLIPAVDHHRKELIKKLKEKLSA